MSDKSAKFKRTINPALIAALDHFASHKYDWNQPTLFRYTEPTTHLQSDWPVERCCALAHEILDREELSLLKLHALQAGLKDYGLEDVYERIMGEKLK